MLWKPPLLTPRSLSAKTRWREFGSLGKGAMADPVDVLPRVFRSDFSLATSNLGGAYCVPHV